MSSARLVSRKEAAVTSDEVGLTLSDRNSSYLAGRKAAVIERVATRSSVAAGFVGDYNTYLIHVVLFLPVLSTNTAIELGTA